MSLTGPRVVSYFLVASTLMIIVVGMFWPTIRFASLAVPTRNILAFWVGLDALALFGFLVIQAVKDVSDLKNRSKNIAAIFQAAIYLVAILLFVYFIYSYALDVLFRDR